MERLDDAGHLGSTKKRVFKGPRKKTFHLINSFKLQNIRETKQTILWAPEDARRRRRRGRSQAAVEIQRLTPRGRSRFFSPSGVTRSGRGIYFQKFGAPAALAATREALTRRARPLCRDMLSSVLAEKHGITSKAVRDVWNLRTWAWATKSFWTSEDFLRKHLCDSCQEQGVKPWDQVPLPLSGAYCACAPLLPPSPFSRPHTRACTRHVRSEGVCCHSVVRQMYTRR